MKILWTLKPFFQQHKRDYIIGILFLLLVDFLQLITPRMLGNFADAFQDRQLTSAGLWYYGSIIVLAAMGIAAFRFVWRLNLSGASRRLEYWLRNKLYQHFLKLDSRFYDRRKIGDLMAHATNDVHAVRMSLSMGVVMLIDSIVLTAATITIMLTTIDVRLTLMAIIPLPIMTGTATFFGRLIHRRFREVQAAFSGMTEIVQENVSGIRVIKSFVQESKEITRFTVSANNYVNKNLRLVRISAIFYPLVQLLSSLGFVLVLGFGGFEVIRGNISLGDFVAFNSYLALLTWPMMALGQVINVMQRGSASLERINSILQIEPEVIDIKQAAKHFDYKGRLAVQNLTYAYQEGTAVLKSVDFTLQPGQTLGIVGHTGSGKTTLANLIVRLYEPPIKCVFLDGQEIHNISLAELRRQVGYVPQDTFLFSTTIKENIAFGGTFSAAEIQQAVQNAHLTKDIAEMPNGLDTLVGERGVTLSGGQKQRVAIARVLLENPPLLMLDDSLSAVDTETEAAILQSIKHLRQNRSTIIIAHRISALQHADLILVLSNGAIIERGRHQDLIELQGMYAHLWLKQQLEADLVKEG